MFILVALLTISITSAEGTSLECQFDLQEMEDDFIYFCALFDIEVLDPLATVEFTGTHSDGKTNADITAVIILDSNTPFIIQDIFSTFENIELFAVVDSNLQTLNFPESSSLLGIDFYGNNITTIENRAFQAFPHLETIFIAESNIQDIKANAFSGIPNLQSLFIIDNNFRELAPRIFQPLVNVVDINLGNNGITTVGHDLLPQNSNVRWIRLPNNQINEISPRFLDNMRGNTFLLSLLNNRCINDVFFLDDDDSWNEMNNALQTCFNNFNETAPETRKITMEFSGSMTVTDESGNVIVRI